RKVRDYDSLIMDADVQLFFIRQPNCDNSSQLPLKALFRTHQNGKGRPAGPACQDRSRCDRQGEEVLRFANNLLIVVTEFCDRDRLVNPAQQLHIGTATKTHGWITEMDNLLVHFDCFSKPASITARIEDQYVRVRPLFLSVIEVQLQSLAMQVDLAVE